MTEFTVSKAIDKSNGDKTRHLWKVTMLLESYEETENDTLYEDMADYIAEAYRAEDLSGFEFEYLQEVDT